MLFAAQELEKQRDEANSKLEAMQPVERLNLCTPGCRQEMESTSDLSKRELEDLAGFFAVPAGRALSFHACCVRRDRRRKITGRSCCRPLALARLRGGGMG